MKKIIVISLGGSLIVPDKLSPTYLGKFRRTLKKYYKKYKFVIVCGGGKIARKYIESLKSEGKTEKELSEAGILATRMNAKVIMKIFGKEANSELPMSMQDVVNNLAKNNVVICGALRWKPKSTSDTTAVNLAHKLKTDFINLTNVKGLYTSDPRINPSAKFIHKISSKEFEKMAKKHRFKPGQNFIIDQQAASLINKHKIQTLILGPGLKNLNRLLKGKSFQGTIIENDN